MRAHAYMAYKGPWLYLTYGVTGNLQIQIEKGKCIAGGKFTLLQ